MEWRDSAACRDVDPELFFPLTNSGPSEYQTAQALRVCRTCPVQSDCLDWALQQEVLHGVWGGLSETQRISVLRSRRRPVGASASASATHVS